jgi:hypothetical protein
MLKISENAPDRRDRTVYISNAEMSVEKKMTFPRRRFTAAMNPDYMFTVIFKN